MPPRNQDVVDALTAIGTEVATVVAALVRSDADGLARVADLVAAAPRVFVLGAGRSGLALRMTAMRLMHLGLDVHVVGEVTTPAIERGDLLVTASGSGTTVLIALGAFAPVALALLPVAGGVAWGVLRSARPKLERVVLGLERVLDELQSGQPRQELPRNGIVGLLAEEVRRALGPGPSRG